MKHVKKFKNYTLSLSITQLMGLLVMFNIVSCDQCSSGTPHESQMTVAINNNNIQGNEKAAITFKNKGEIGGPVIALAPYTLKATISGEKGGTGSKFVYKDHEGTEKFEFEIDAALSDLIAGEHTALGGQETQTIHVGIAPNNKVTALTINLEILEAGTSIHTATIHWTAGPPSISEKLSIVAIKPAVGDQHGTFAVKAVDRTVNLKDVEVSWTTNNSTSFQVGGKELSGKIMLADLLGNKNLLANEEVSAPITYQIQKDNNNPSANIEISFQEGDQEIGKGQVQWTKEAHKHDLSLALAYDQTTEKVTYTITNNGDTQVEKKDKLTLRWEVSNNALVKSVTTEKKTQKLKIDGLLAGQSASGELCLDFHDKPSTTITWILKVGDAEYERQKVEYFADAKLIFDMEDAEITLKKAKNTTQEYTLKLKNTGTASILLDKLRLQARRGKGQVVVIKDIQAIGVDHTEFTIPTKGNRKQVEIHSNKHFEVKTTVQLPKSEVEGHLTFQLFYDGQELPGAVHNLTITRKQNGQQ